MIYAATISRPDISYAASLLWPLHLQVEQDLLASSKARPLVPFEGQATWV
jgi:hypothetical protein